MRQVFRRSAGRCDRGRKQMKKAKKKMGKKLIKLILVFMLFFVGTCCIAAVDTICKESTGHGGKLVFDVEKIGLFN